MSRAGSSAHPAVTYNIMISLSNARTFVSIPSAQNSPERYNADPPAHWQREAEDSSPSEWVWGVGARARGAVEDRGPNSQGSADRPATKTLSGRKVK